MKGGKGRCVGLWRQQQLQLLVLHDTCDPGQKSVRSRTCWPVAMGCREDGHDICSIPPWYISMKLHQVASICTIAAFQSPQTHTFRQCHLINRRVFQTLLAYLKIHEISGATSQCCRSMACPCRMTSSAQQGGCKQETGAHTSCLAQMHSSHTLALMLTTPRHH